MPIVRLDAAVVDSTSGSNTNISGLSFPVAAGRRYWFRAFIPYNSAATTTGAEFGVDVPSSPTWLGFKTEMTSNDTLGTDATEVDYDGTDDGSSVGSSSATATATEVNIAIVEGFVVPSVAGEVQFRMDTEVNSSAITVRAGAFVEYRDLGV